METWKAIAVALGAAFALALAAWLFALIVRRPLEEVAEEATLPPEELRRLHPPWSYWISFPIFALFAIIEFAWTGNSGFVIFWSPLAATVVGSAIASIWYAQQLRVASDDPLLRKHLQRHFGSSLVWMGLFSVLLIWLLLRRL